MRKIFILYIKNSMTLALFLVFTLCYLSECLAKDLYVSPSGSDSVTYTSNDISHPWLTPSKAWYNAQPGDIVYFRSGKYNVSVMINTNGSNGYDGTAERPITFMSYPGESATIQAIGGSGAMFQISKDYNIIKNLTIDAGGFFHRVFAVGWYDGEAVTGFTAEGLKILNWADGDNCNAFYVGSSYAAVTARNITIKKCTLTGLSGGANQNYSGIQVFGATEFSIENNDISRVRRGIYIKHSSVGYSDHNDLIKNNFVHDLNTGGIGLRINGNYVDVINNIIVGSTQFGEDAESGTNPNGTYLLFDHNTFFGTFEQLYDGGGVYARLTNNVFNSSVYIFRYSSNPENPQIDETNYNLYGNSIIHKGVTYSLSSWKTHLSLDNTGGSRDVNSFSGLINFEGGLSPSAIPDFQLASSSNGYKKASDGKDIGAYTPNIGVDGDVVIALPPPTIPTSFKLN